MSLPIAIELFQNDHAKGEGMGHKTVEIDILPGSSNTPVYFVSDVEENMEQTVCCDEQHGEDDGVTQRSDEENVHRPERNVDAVVHLHRINKNKKIFIQYTNKQKYTITMNR